MIGTITNVNDEDKDNKRKNVDNAVTQSEQLVELDSSCVQTQHKDDPAPSKKA